MLITDYSATAAAGFHFHFFDADGRAAIAFEIFFHCHDFLLPFPALRHFDDIFITFQLADDAATPRHFRRFSAFRELLIS